MNGIEEFFGHFCQSFVVFSRCAISDSHVHILLKYRLHNHLTFAFEPLHCRFLRLGTNPTHNSNQHHSRSFFFFIFFLLWFILLLLVLVVLVVGTVVAIVIIEQCSAHATWLHVDYLFVCRLSTRLKFATRNMLHLM